MTRAPHRTTRTAGLIALLLALTASGCQVEPDVTYGLETLELGSATADKDRLKSLDQWIVILHADLFGEVLEQRGALYDIKQALFMRVGDQEPWPARCSWYPTSCKTQTGCISPILRKSSRRTPTPSSTTPTCGSLVRYPTEAERTWLQATSSHCPPHREPRAGVHGLRPQRGIPPLLTL